jgi:hypothetical protein
MTANDLPDNSWMHYADKQLSMEQLFVGENVLCWLDIGQTALENI